MVDYMLIIGYLPPKGNRKLHRKKAKKRFSEATEVCEEVHERFQQVPGGGGGGLQRFVFMKVTEIKGILNGMKIKHTMTFFLVVGDVREMIQFGDVLFQIELEATRLYDVYIVERQHGVVVTWTWNPCHLLSFLFVVFFGGGERYRNYKGVGELGGGCVCQRHGLPTFPSCRNSA